jgi:pimeloyl-ACP methyl ester carboxylesterase
MECRINEGLVHYVEHCDGVPLVALHGAELLLGHSYGAYLTRGVAARRPRTVLALALLCPVADRSRNVPDHDVVRRDDDAYDELDSTQRAGFEEYFVVRIPVTARRYRDRVVAGKTRRPEFLAALFRDWLDRARPEDE